MKKYISIILSILIVLSSLTCLTGLTVSAEAENLFINGDFKDCNISSNTVSGWKATNGGSNVTVHEGEDFNYFTLTERTDKNEASSVYNNIPVNVKKNTSYTIKFWIKTTEDSAVRFYLYEPQYYFALKDTYGKTDTPWESKNLYTYNYDGGNHRVIRTDIIHNITDSRASFTRSTNSSMANLAGSEKYSSTNGEWVQVTHKFTTGNEDIHEAAVRYAVYVDPANTAQEISVGGFEMYGEPTNANVVKAPASDDYDLGYVTPANGVVAAEGDKLTFTATPYGNNMFLGWYDGDTLVSEDAELTYTYSASTPMTYKAKFGQSKYTVSTSMEDYADGTIVTAPAVTDDWRLTLGTLQSVSDEAHTGNKSVKVSTDARSGYLGRRIKNLRPNTEYTVSFWTKMRVEYTATTDTNSYTYFSLTTPEVSPGSIADATEGVYVKNYLIGATGIWQQNTVTFNTGDTTEAVLWLNYCSDKVSENTLWVDDISCTCKLEGGISVSYEDIDGNDYFEPQNLAAPVTKLAEKGGNILSASVKYNAMNGAIIFKGWYEGDTFKSSDEEYLFKQDDIFAVDLTAKFIVTNVLGGAASFESYAHGTSLRVSPKAEGVPPTGDKWGINENKTYEADTQNFGLDTIKGDYSNTYIDTLDYSPETGQTTYTEAGEIVTPYSGDTMLGLKYKYRSLVRKIDNLKPNTDYTLSFYVYNPDDWNYLRRAIIANHYDIPEYLYSTAYYPAKDKRVYAYYEADTYEEYYWLNPELANKNEVRKWHKVNINFTTGDDTSSYYLHFAATTKNHNASYTTFIDDLVCYETIFDTVGNSIRAVGANVPQALRYKFTIDNDKLNSLGDYTTNELGLLVIKNNRLGNKELVIDGQYKNEEKTYTPIKKAVDFNKNLQYVDGDDNNTYFTGALYNIGYNGATTDYTVYADGYTVRPYIIYKNATDGKTITIYGDEMSSSVFDVMYAIREARQSQNDLDIVDGLLEKDELFAAYKDWQPRDGFFYDKEPVTDFDYTFAVVGDIQMTTDHHPEDLHYTYDWILENKDKKNIQYVMGLGDLTNGSTDDEYITATTQLDRVKAAGIPQTIVRGNHDRPAAFNTYITQEKYGACLGGKFGSYDSTMRNTYRIMTIGGVKYMMLTLDFYPTADMVSWACGVVEANPDCNVIVSTHGYFESTMQHSTNDAVYGTGGGKYIYENLILKYENIVMVLCGHEYVYGPTYRMATGEHGNQIIQMMINPQRWEELDNRSYGMIALFHFSNDGKTLQIEYLSTITGEYYQERFQFTLDVDTVE